MANRGRHRGLPRQDPIPITDPIWNPQVPTARSKWTSIATGAGGGSKPVTTQQQRELMVGGRRTPVPIPYGRTKFGASILFFDLYQSYWYVIAGWGRGPIDAIETIYIGSKTTTEYGASVVVSNFLGTSSQTCPAAMTTAFAEYEDDLPYLAYSFIKIHSATEALDLNISAVIRGLKPYDPRDGGQDSGDESTWVYSNNPALCAADYLRSGRYGRNYGISGIDWDAVEDAADYCDEDVSGSPRRTIGLCIQDKRDARAWQDELRRYAACFSHETGGKAYFIPDAPRSVDHTFIQGQYNPDTWTINYKSAPEKYDCVQLSWTDPDGDWADHTITKPDEGGSKPLAVSLIGITEHSEAERQAIQLYNREILIDRTWRADITDYGLQVVPGDLASFTREGIITAGKFRILNARRLGKRAWQLAGEAYDENVYSNATASPNSWYDPSLPDPTAPPTPTTVSAALETYTKVTGEIKTRIRTTWDDMEAAGYPYVKHYHLELIEDGVVTQEAIVRSGQSWGSKDVEENVTCTVKVYTVSKRTNARSTAGTDTLNSDADSTAPAQVTGVVAVGITGGVRITWNPNTEPDLKRYWVWKKFDPDDDWDDVTFWGAFYHGWDLDDSQYPYDFSVGDTTATVIGSPQRLTSNSPGAGLNLYFPGTENNIIFNPIGTPYIIDPRDQFSFAVWLKVLTGGWVDNTPFFDIYRDVNNYCRLIMVSTSELKCEWVESSSDKSFTTSGAGLVENAWNFIGFRSDVSTGFRRIRVNNSLKGSSVTAISGFDPTALRFGNISATYDGEFYLSIPRISNDYARDFWNARNQRSALPVTGGYYLIGQTPDTEHIDKVIVDHSTECGYKVGGEDYAGNLGTLSEEAI